MPKPANDSARILALKEAEILDTLPEQDFDELAELASQLCQCPMGLVTVVDDARVWFKARVGMKLPEIPRRHSFCNYAILQPGLLIVPDATQDSRFSKGILSAEPTSVRFYAGVPIRTLEGYPMGTLCVMDQEPKVLTEQQENGLYALARQLGNLLHLRRLQAQKLTAAAEMDTLARQLNAARAEVDRARRIKETFINSVSHELRQPLNSIVGFSEILMSEPPERLHEELHSYLDKIRSLARDQIQNIADLIDVTRIEAGTVALNPKRFPVEPLVRECIEEARGMAETNGNDLVYGCDDGLPLMFSDPARLKQILLSLLMNACRHTQKGRVVVEVHTRTLGEQQWLVFRVTDNGPGMSKSQLTRLFTYREAATTDPGPVALVEHLSLAISRRLAAMMCGDIEASSQPGKGTTLALVVPFMLPDETREEERAVSPEDATT